MNWMRRVIRRVIRMRNLRISPAKSRKNPDIKNSIKTLIKEKDSLIIKRRSKSHLIREISTINSIITKTTKKEALANKTGTSIRTKEASAINRAPSIREASNKREISITKTSSKTREDSRESRTIENDPNVKLIH